MLDHFILSLLFIAKARTLGAKDKVKRKPRTVINKVLENSEGVSIPSMSGAYVFMPNGEFRSIRYPHEDFTKKFIHRSGTPNAMYKLGIGRVVVHGGGVAVQAASLTNEQKKELKFLARIRNVHLEGDVWGRRSFYITPDHDEDAINSALSKF